MRVWGWFVIVSVDLREGGGGRGMDVFVGFARADITSPLEGFTSVDLV
jgi:hypothetical protein